uniref:MD-2-related lipid-recognition domain-containing protein n=1 Tax=Stomoxys calcitrans TaxID=35570 RepID=A0A1I8P3L0_STOCA
MLNKHLSLLILIEFLAPSQTLRRPFNIDIQRVTCTTFDKLVDHLECNSAKQATSRYAFSVFFKLSDTMPLHTEVAILIRIKTKNALRSLKIFDIKVSVCDLLKQVKLVPLVKEIIGQLGKHSNLPSSCPITAKMYNISNVIISDEIFPIHGIVADFNFSLTFVDRQKHVATYTVQGTTWPKSQF